MGIMDDAKDGAETAGRKIQDAWEDTTDKIDDKFDEMKAAAFSWLTSEPVSSTTPVNS